MKALRIAFWLAVLSGQIFSFFAARELLSQVQNACSMTYMWPNYIPINISTHSRYTLVLYKDGTAPDNKELTGTPVLFIPGNAGSKHQVRSLGAVASRKHQVHGGPKLDFFAVDFAEELGALSATLLRQEAVFANECLAHILSLYKGRASGVIVIGHSMGGVVARSLMIGSNYVAESVRLIIALAAPLSAPPIVVAPEMRALYEAIHGYWKQPTEPIPVISIGGGVRDSLVDSSLVIPRGNDHGVSFLTTAIPEVWLTTDHQCIVWCNEVVVRVVDYLRDVQHLTLVPSPRNTPAPTVHLASTLARCHFQSRLGKVDRVSCPPGVPPAGHRPKPIALSWTVPPWARAFAAVTHPRAIASLVGSGQGGNPVVVESTILPGGYRVIVHQHPSSPTSNIPIPTTLQLNFTLLPAQSREVNTGNNIPLPQPPFPSSYTFSPSDIVLHKQVQFFSHSAHSGGAVSESAPGTCITFSTVNAVNPSTTVSETAASGEPNTWCPPQWTNTAQSWKVKFNEEGEVKAPWVMRLAPIVFGETVGWLTYEVTIESSLHSSKTLVVPTTVHITGHCGESEGNEELFFTHHEGVSKHVLHWFQPVKRMETTVLSPPLSNPLVSLTAEVRWKLSLARLVHRFSGQLIPATMAVGWIALLLFSINDLGSHLSSAKKVGSVCAVAVMAMVVTFILISTGGFVLDRPDRILPPSHFFLPLMLAIGILTFVALLVTVNVISYPQKWYTCRQSHSGPVTAPWLTALIFLAFSSVFRWEVVRVVALFMLIVRLAWNSSSKASCVVVLSFLGSVDVIIRLVVMLNTLSWCTSRSFSSCEWYRVLSAWLANTVSSPSPAEDGDWLSATFSLVISVSLVSLPLALPLPLHRTVGRVNSTLIGLVQLMVIGVMVVYAVGVCIPNPYRASNMLYGLLVYRWLELVSLIFSSKDKSE